MSLSSLVCAREYAERLKKLGVKQESLFWWRANEDPNTGKPINYWIIEYGESRNDYEYNFSAFTASELGERLQHWIQPPEGDEEKMDSGMVEIFKDKSGVWFVKYLYVHLTYADTLVDAMAKMTIWLLENRLMKV